MASDIFRYELKPRNEIKEDKRKEIMNNGKDNKYPTNIQRLIDGSSTAKQAARMYSRFLAGQGFEDETLNTVVIATDITGYKKFTALQLLKLISDQFSYYYGVYIHRTLNANKKAVRFRIFDFRWMRFGKLDDKNYGEKLVYYDNWDKSKESRIREGEFIKYDSYNTDEKVIDEQVESAGSFADYKGQVYYEFFDNTELYPLAQCDVVQHDMDTENMIQLFKNGELRRGFFAKYILAHKAFDSEEKKRDFFGHLQTFQGAENGGSILVTQGAIQNNDGEIVAPFTLEKVEQNINSNLFKEYESSVSNNIRKAFNNIPPVLIDYQEGKLGVTSGESVKQANDFYNQQTKQDRMIIEQIFTRLMKDFANDELTNKRWDIKELKLYSENESEITPVNPEAVRNMQINTLIDAVNSANDMINNIKEIQETNTQK